MKIGLYCSDTNIVMSFDEVLEKYRNRLTVKRDEYGIKIVAPIEDDALKIEIVNEIVGSFCTHPKKLFQWYYTSKEGTSQIMIIHI